MQRALDVPQERIAGKVPMVEEIQDAVEEALLGSRYQKKKPKAYIIYRDQHSKCANWCLRRM